MIVQIYEIQTPSEAQQMVSLGVDHIGSVLLPSDLSPNEALKETVDLVRSSGCKSSLIPLFADMDRIVQMVEYYCPDIVHFCDTLPAPETDAAALNLMVQRQQAVRKHFPGLEIMRSIPIGRTGYGAKVARWSWHRFSNPSATGF
jgi:phosphoribosylanthranilate isomerase